MEAIFYGSGTDLEYDLRLGRNVPVDRIRISVNGAQGISIDDSGNLSILTDSGILQHMRPRAFQGGRAISAGYVLLGTNEVGLRLGRYDRRAPVTIDPVLSYVKTFGNAGSNQANQVATDAAGNIYLAGQSNGVDFPTTAGSVEPSSSPTLRVLSNAGNSIRSLPVKDTFSVGEVGATPDGGILYASTSRGILVSVDSGSTWQQTAALPVAGLTNALPTVTAFSIDPFDPATVLVATNVGLFGTDSAGQSWGERNTGLNVSASGSVSVASVFYNPVNPLVAYAVTSGPSNLFASSDAGNTWRRLDPTFPGEPAAPSFSFSPNLAATITPDGATLFAINGNGTLFKSADGGDTWIKLVQGFFAPVSIQVDPSNSATVYVLDSRGLHKSIDGGGTFVDLSTPVSARSFVVDSSGAVYVGGLTFPLYVSADGTRTFSAVLELTGQSSLTLSASGSSVYVGSFSPTTPFVIKLDPSGQSILYSTFLGGSSGDVINGLAVDAQGEAVLVGTVSSLDFPLTIPATSPPAPGKSVGFIAKLSADGTSLIYSTAIAASKSVTIQAVALDSSGAVFVTGQSYSSDLATTPNVFESTLPSTPCSRPPTDILGPPIPPGSAFVSKISADGKSAVYTTFLTGSCGSYANGITIDAAGDAVVAGVTASPDFPVLANAYQPAFPGPGKPTTPPGSAVNAGFLSKISPAGDKLLASTFLGGGYSTQAIASVLDASENVYVTGFTQGFATGATAGAYQTSLVDKCPVTQGIGPSPLYTGTGDAFVLKLDSAFSAPAFLTYLGGGCNDSGTHIALDPSGDIWVSGTTSSPDFPLKAPFQASAILSSPIQGFVSELSGDGSQLLFSSFSQGSVLALGTGSVYLAGSSGPSGLVARIDPSKSPAVSIDSILPVVAFPTPTIGPFYGGVAPGELVQISGRNLGPATTASAQLDASGHLPFILANTVVLFDNIPAPLLSVSDSKILCYVPFEVVSTAKVTVSANGEVSTAVLIGIPASAPQILSIINQDGSVNAPSNPAKAGSVITLYVSGLGQTNPPSADGLVNGSPLPVPLAAVTVYFPVAPSAVTPQFVGAAPGLIAGISQVNVQVPSTIPSSGTTNPISIRLNNAGASLYTAP